MFKHQIVFFATTALVCVFSINPHLALAAQSVDFGEFTNSQLESRLAASQAEIKRLAPITLRDGVGNLGWESQTHKTAERTEWVRIELAQECLIDQIVLVPILWRDVRGVVHSDGFPTEVKILAGKTGDEVGMEIASFDESNTLLPRVAPVVISIAPTQVEWIRVEAIKLGTRKLDDRNIFQLSEVMIFSEDENVALGSATMTSSVTRNRVNKSTRAEALVDGFTPYLMTAADGKGSKPFVGFFRTGPEVTFTFDLKEPKQIHRIHLHAADRRQNVPQIHHADYAMPKHFIVEGANEADFSDAEQLFEYRKTSIYDSGPIVMLQFKPYECRFVRLTALEAYKAPEAKESFRCIGFAEIEIFENDQNVVAGVVPDTDIKYVGSGREGKLAALTDQRNYFGAIIPMRQWITQLARSHDLTSEIAQLQTLQKTRNADQRKYFRWALGLIAFLALAIITTVLINRFLRDRETSQLKARFAADLHDEVGADLHAIALLSDLAKEEHECPGQRDSILQEIRSVCEDASTSVRHVTDAQKETPYIKLPDLMRQAASRIVIGLEHEIDIEGTEHIERLQPNTRAQILLFFKECLVNASRHAEASFLKTSLKVTPKTVQLTMEDNGHGIEGSEENWVPPSLERRAKLLGAKVNVESCLERGTKIQLDFKRLQWKYFKKR